MKKTCTQGYLKHNKTGKKTEEKQLIVPLSPTHYRYYLPTTGAGAKGSDRTEIFRFKVAKLQKAVVGTFQI